MQEDTEKLFGDKKLPPRVMLKRLSHYILPEWKAFVLAFILIIVNVGLAVILPLFIREFTNVFSKNNTTLAIILGITIGYFSVSLVSQVLVYFESMILQHVGQRIVYKLRMEVF